MQAARLEALAQRAKVAGLLATAEEEDGDGEEEGAIGAHG